LPTSNVNDADAVPSVVGRRRHVPVRVVRQRNAAAQRVRHPDGLTHVLVLAGERGARREQRQNCHDHEQPSVSHQRANAHR